MGMVQRYHTILKIGPGAHIFQRPFLRGLFFFGGAYLQREICVSKSIGLALGVGSKFTVFALFYFVFEGYFASTSPRGEGLRGAYIWTWVFCVTGLGGLYLVGLIHGGAFFRNFTVCDVGARNSKGGGGVG